ncbi:cytochrome c family protein [Magnetospirillum sp. UT-4]|uniref:c-type cytochrome n=1 Tax=Magnetospirillum sp. UT-4 TaxID=2681467 RepID=UPI001381BD33|nr:cytochrome c family protein [Magnetospirillum sp. UT-4]CAA7619410.1 Cytochrome c family protein [Magnetospirillum sp. UT-4]
MFVRLALALVPLAALYAGTAQAQGPAPAPAPPGDAAAGAKVFNQCKACHTVEPGKNRVGPSLHGIVGRPSGKVEGFKYSPAMAGANLTWTPENLDKYLADPKGFIPGNKMAYAGLKKPEDRANVIAYLATQK